METGIFVAPATRGHMAWVLPTVGVGLLYALLRGGAQPRKFRQAHDKSSRAVRESSPALARIPCTGPTFRCRVRDETLVDLGVRLEDKADGSSVWKPEDPAVLRQASRR